MHQAVSKGGRKLDAYGKGLYYFYTRNNFKPVSWTPFNKDYAPKDWKPSFEKIQNLHIIFYVYDKNFVPTQTYEEFINLVPACTGDNGYYEAAKIRDSFLK